VHAVALKLTRRRRPPSPRRLIGLLWIAICLVSLANAVMKIAAGHLVVIYIPIAILWVILYSYWRKIARGWELLEELDIPLPLWELRLQLTMVSIQLFATALLFIA
jgi:hypothetical protein